MAETMYLLEKILYIVVTLTLQKILPKLHSQGSADTWQRTKNKYEKLIRSTVCE